MQCKRCKTEMEKIVKTKFKKKQLKRRYCFSYYYKCKTCGRIKFVEEAKIYPKELEEMLDDKLKLF